MPRTSVKQRLEESLASHKELTSIFMDDPKPLLLCSVDYSKTGMSRKINIVYVMPDRELRYITYHVAKLLRKTYKKDCTLVYNGCGYDALYELEQDLAEIYKRPFTVKEVG